MSFPDRVRCFSRFAGRLYITAAVLFWVSALLVLSLTKAKWAGALEFVGGVICLLMWQTSSGAKSVSG
jgi:uncharacterized membrane protein YgdD (TMEM256/DUF423 family)